MKVLIVSGDVGGARAVMPAVKKLFDSGAPFVISDNGFLGQEAPPDWPRVHLAIDSGQQSIERMLRQEAIGTVVFTTSVKDIFPLRISRVARQLDLPVICLLDNWVDYRGRLEIDGLPALIPDVYAVMDKLAYHGAIEDGIPASVLKITGQPALSSLTDEYKVIYPDLCMERLASLGIKPGRKLVVFISEPAEEDEGGPKSDRFRGYTEKTVLREFCRHMQSYAPNVYIGVIVHPRENCNTTKDTWLGCRGNLEGGILSLNRGRDGVFLADGVAGMASILLYEAWLLGKPLITMQPGLRYPHLDFMRNRRGCHCLKEQDDRAWKKEIASWMKDLLLDKNYEQVRKEFVFHAGAAQRLCDIVKDFLCQEAKK
jgi:hypothetical protein